MRAPRAKRRADGPGMVAWGWYGVVELPAGSPVPTPALAVGHAPLAVRTARAAAFWAAWWTEHPTADPWVPPDAMGIVEGAFAQAEAIGAADAAIRRAKGPRAYATTVGEGFARQAYTAGAVRVRSAALDFETAAPAAFALLGLDMECSVAAIRSAYRAIVAERRLHPDQGGDVAAFRDLSAAERVAIAWARARGREQRREKEVRAAQQAKSATVTAPAPGEPVLKVDEGPEEPPAPPAPTAPALKPEKQRAKWAPMPPAKPKPGPAPQRPPRAPRRRPDPPATPPAPAPKRRSRRAPWSPTPADRLVMKRVHAIASRIRRSAERIAAVVGRPPDLAGLCHVLARTLCQVFAKADIPVEMVTGTMVKPYRGGHSWVEVVLSAGKLIVDITATQYGPDRSVVEMIDPGQARRVEYRGERRGPEIEEIVRLNYPTLIESMGGDLWWTTA